MSPKTCNFPVTLPFARFAFVQNRGTSWVQSALDQSAVGRRILHQFGHRVLNHRYLALGILFNLPGNWVIGGGGGLVLASGLSGSFSWGKFLFTVAAATCFIPILAYLGIISVVPMLKALLHG